MKKQNFDYYIVEYIGCPIIKNDKAFTEIRFASVYEYRVSGITSSKYILSNIKRKNPVEWAVYYCTPQISDIINYINKS